MNKTLKTYASIDAFDTTVSLTKVCFRMAAQHLPHVIPRNIVYKWAAREESEKAFYSPLSYFGNRDELGKLAIDDLVDKMNTATTGAGKAAYAHRIMDIALSQRSVALYAHQQVKALADEGKIRFSLPYHGVTRLTASDRDLDNVSERLFYMDHDDKYRPGLLKRLSNKIAEFVR